MRKFQEIFRNLSSALFSKPSIRPDWPSVTRATVSIRHTNRSVVRTKPRANFPTRSSVRAKPRAVRTSRSVCREKPSRFRANPSGHFSTPSGVRTTRSMNFLKPRGLLSAIYNILEERSINLRQVVGYLCTNTQESTISRVVGDFTYFAGLFVSAISIKKPSR